MSTFIQDKLQHLSLQWESNNNYGLKLIIEDILADISLHTEKQRKACDIVRYVASIHAYGSGIEVEPRQETFDDMAGAKRWCEDWVRHFYKHLLLQKEVERLQDWLKHYSEEFYKLREKVNEQEWQKIQQQFNYNHGQDDRLTINVPSQDKEA